MVAPIPAVVFVVIETLPATSVALDKEAAVDAAPIAIVGAVVCWDCKCPSLIAGFELVTGKPVPMPTWPRLFCINCVVPALLSNLVIGFWKVKAVSAGMTGENGLRVVRDVAEAIAVMICVWPAAIIVPPTDIPLVVKIVPVPVTVVPALEIVPPCHRAAGP